MAKFISDDEMMGLEKSGKVENVDLAPRMKPNKLTDAQMAELERSHKEDTSGEAFMEGLGDGGSLGYGAQIKSAMLPAIAKVDSWINGTDYDRTMEDLGDYTTRRDKLIRNQEELAAANPKAFAAGNVAGAVASAGLIPGGAGMKAAAGAGKLARLGQLAGQGAKIGAIQGALMNPGDVEGEVDLLQLGGRLENAGKGAATGAAGGALVEGAGQGLSAAGSKLKKISERKAFKALGPYARDAIKANDKDSIEKVGRVLLDEGVVSMKPTSYEGVASRAEKALGKKGKELGQYVEDLDAAGKSLMDDAPGLIKPGTPRTSGAGVDRSAIAQSMREDLLNQNLDIPGVAAKNARMEKLIQEFEAGDDKLIGLLEAEAKKKSVGKEIKWDRLPGADIPVEEQVQRSLYSKLKQGVEDGASFLDDKLNAGVGKFKKLKNEYGALSEANSIADRRGAREFANRFLSPSDYGMGALGAGAGFASGNDMESKLKNAAIGGSLGLANKFARQQGNQILAAGGDKLSNVLMKSPVLSDLASRSPKAFQALAQKLGGPKKSFAEKPADNFDNNEQLLRLIQQKPELLDGIENAQLRESLKKRLETVGELDTDSSRSSNYQPTGKQKDDDAAKSRFLQGN